MAVIYNNVNQPYSNYTLAGATGTTNTVLTSAGSNGTAWLAPNTNFSSSNGTPIMTIPYGEDKIQIDKKATLEVNGTIVMNGMDLDERLKTIEKVLLIPERDVILEAKHPKLKKMYDEYITALEKYRTWERIKGDENE